jgi:tRNA nucleotidyltransferase (CCA-adding enzyme)
MNTSQIKAVCDKVLKDIVPTEAEQKKVESVINFAEQSLLEEIRRQKINAEVMVGGSIGKNTWLRNKHDIDIFVRFDLDYEDSEIGALLGNVVKKVFKKFEIAHGTRDYYRVDYKGYEIEIVPTLRISDPSQAKNSMDASPFHVKYVKNKARINNLSKEIRLLKAFAKAQGVYGAETHISGFSGYSLELLTIHYGSFLKLLEEFENAKPKIVIDIEKHYSKTEDVFKLLPESKLNSPIIIIDPVLKERNASAAVELKTFSTLLFAIRTFIRKPSTSFFKQKKVGLSEHKQLSKKRGTLLVTKIIEKPAEKEDIFLAKLKKAIESTFILIEKEGIEIYDYGFFEEGQRIVIYFEIATLKLSEYRKHYGPQVWMPAPHFEAFLKKYKNVYTDDVDLVVDVKRKFTSIEQMVLDSLDKELKNV